MLGCVFALPGCQSSGLRVADVGRPAAATPAGSASIAAASSPDSQTALASFQIAQNGNAEQVAKNPNEIAAATDLPAANDQAIQVIPGVDEESIAPVLVDSRSTPVPVSLSDLVARALATHPTVAAARQRVAAAQHRIPQVTALDDPTLGNTFWPIQDQALQTAGGRIGHQFALTQKVPWPAKLNARGSVASREVQVAIAESARAELEITEAVRLAYYQLWLAEELVQIVDENGALVDDLIEVAEARYRTGGSQQDILRAQLEGDRLAEQMISLRLQKEQARADLGALVRQPLDWMSIAVDELILTEASPRLDELVAQAEACNPTLQGLAAEIARDRAKESLACLQQYPDFQLGLGYSIVDDDTNVISPVANGHDNINFTVGITLPVWRDKINAGIREAAHNRSSTTLRREAEQDKLRGTLRRQVAAADAAVEQLELFRNRLIPRTEQTLEIVIADYQGKRADFTDLIATYHELLALQVQVARSKAALASTMAQIERTVGCP
ncbi:TolC family protein [Rubripirellula lacrimiformis]|uniref:TolC family protein n=1 Tax=Rubripirellula lacrimiformis TaxID=1930273 RepID=UPI001FE730E4|nr:TolC family protein [Rubripirellula lacrimiformis]